MFFQTYEVNQNQLSHEDKDSKEKKNLQTKPVTLRFSLPCHH